jgi:hypothetical protein
VIALWLENWQEKKRQFRLWYACFAGGIISQKAAGFALRAKNYSLMPRHGSINAHSEIKKAHVQNAAYTAISPKCENV